MKKETIVIVGYGWVGQANALALSHAGYETYYYDIAIPLLKYTPKYDDLYAKVKALRKILEKDGADTWYVVCVGDRVSEEGQQDISAIKKALKSLQKAKGGVVLRSTILPGNLAGLSFDHYVPEFLHEKKAVEEVMEPSYFVVGSLGKNARKPSFFAHLEKRAAKVFHGTPEEASYIKYLSNIWNALRIAFVNEFGNAIAEPKDPVAIAAIDKVMNFFFERKAYVQYGRSFGGHCLPKDTRAFFAWHKARGKDMSIVEGMYRSNSTHQVIEKKHSHMPEWFSHRSS